MRFRSTLSLMAVGLVLSTTAFAQSRPIGAAPLPPADPEAKGRFLDGPPRMPATIQSSRIRAFSAAPDGEVRSLYLKNGSVVNVSPELGRQLSTQAHQGAHISVTGTHTMVNGQRMILANQVTMNSQTFADRLPGGQDGPAGMRPEGGPGMAPPPPPSSNARLNGPGGPRGPRPGGGPIPPPPARPEAGTQGVPPPPPNQGAPTRPLAGPGQRNMPAPPPASGDPATAPVQPAPNAPPAAPGTNNTPGQPSPNAPPTPSPNF